MAGMNKICVSAPGKTILHGEHSVVYGKGAIAASLGLRTFLTLNLGNETDLEISFESLNYKAKWSLPSKIDFSFPSDDSDTSVIPVSDILLKEIVEYFHTKEEGTGSRNEQSITTFLFLFSAITQKYEHGIPKGVKISISTELPIGAGLGSSASYTVCLSAALLCLYGQIDHTTNVTEKQLALINNWAYQGEIILHGKPSGIDNSICTYGGALFFQNGKIVERIINLPEIKILLINTNVPRNTKLLVGNVRERMGLYPTVMEPVLQSMEAISLNQWALLQDIAKREFEAKDFLSWKVMVSMNQHLLNCIGVGHPKLDQICQLAETLNLPAKLTGAGGGGCAMVFLAKDTKTLEIISEFQKEGFQVYEVVVAGAGVSIH